MMRPEWWDKAKCRGVGCDLFFAPPYPEVESSGDRRKREASAKVMCAKCEVKAPCLQEALVHNDDGIRGGLTVGERRRLSVPVPFQRPNPISTDWRIIVNRPNITNTYEVRLEQSVNLRNHFRVVKNDVVVATYLDELEAWIGLHNATT